jgi:MFS family permease
MGASKSKNASSLLNSPLLEEIDKQQQDKHDTTGDGRTHCSNDSCTTKITSATKIYAFCAALNSCNLGYDIGVNTGAGMLLQSSLSLTDVQLEVFMGALNLFAMVGALSSHWISDKFGRRWSFRIAAIIFIFGTVIQSGAGGYASLMFGRAFVGLGVGFGLAVDPGEFCLFVFCAMIFFHCLAFILCACKKD